MSAIQPLLGGKQTLGERLEDDANDPQRPIEGLQAANLSICEEQPVDRFESKGSLAGQCRGFELGTVIRIGAGKSNAKNLSCPWIRNRNR